VFVFAGRRALRRDYAAPGAAEPKENAMSLTTTTTTVTRPHADRRAGSLRRTTVVAGLVAAGTTAVAAALHAAGVSLEVDGEMIPLAGFAQTTFLGAVIGGVLLAVLNRRRRSAHRLFLQTAVALTALSCIPSVTWPDDAATKLAVGGAARPGRRHRRPRPRPWSAV
jgi:Family of unknown function (DUF6069)